VPVSFDPTTREEQLRALRTRVDEILAAGEPFVLIGDFNTAPTEASYGDLAAGMRDVHTAVGTGPGWTWRPSRFEGFGMGLLRIDQAHAGPGVVPLASDVDCPASGDHCRLLVTVAIGDP
jgi:endonuclease/exonuclease/phosphatase (EEP) superfamily protein YafD